MQQVIMMSELLKEYPGVGQMQLPGDIIERPIFPTLHIRMLGTFIIASDRVPLTGIDMPRLQSLLAYLVQHHGVPQSRTRLASLLWPDSTEEQAHTNLRNLLYKLRQALPDSDGTSQWIGTRSCGRAMVPGRWMCSITNKLWPARNKPSKRTIVPHCDWP